jgi:hypothetical protein
MKTKGWGEYIVQFKPWFIYKDKVLYRDAESFFVYTKSYFWETCKETGVFKKTTKQHKIGGSIIRDNLFNLIKYMLFN